MSSRYWLAALAFGLIVTASLQAQEQAQSADDGAQEKQEASGDLPIGIPIRIIENDESTEARERRERESAKREQDDLIAQQRMADATQAMNEATQSMKNAAWLSFVAVAIGTGLLVWTLRLTRQANKAARDAVDVTREMGEAQVRAYISVSQVLVEPPQAGSHLVVKWKIKNYGNSPAKAVVARSVLSLDAYDPESRNLEIRNALSRKCVPIGAGASFVLEKVSENILSVTDVEAIRNGGLRIAFGGHVTYRDAFGKKHGVIFKSMTDVDGLRPDGQLLATKKNNYST